MSVVANVAINVDSRNAVSKLRQVQTQSQQAERAVEGLSRAFGGLAAAFGAGFALTKVIADVKELDTNLRRLGTVGVDVAKISPALSKLSDELGGVASKAELAAASYQAASAGFSDTAGNINILRAATKAATGGLADTQAVTEVLVKTLNSYGMSGNQAIQVTDSISKAVELGNQEWSDYTSQLGRVASIAALAGVSLDEVNAFIASATKNGATAEIAFTGLGATLNTLLQPTKESQEAAAKLGIQWNYSGLQAKGFTGLMAELAVAIDKDKEASARLLGSQEAMRGAFAAASKSGSDFKNILGEIGNAAGKTDADFQTMKGSLENTLKALDTSFKNLSEALGTAFGPTVVATINQTAGAVNGIATAINEMPQPLKTATAEAVKLIAQFLLLQKAIQITIGLQTALAALTIQSSKLSVATTAGSSAFALYANNAAALAPKVTGVSAVIGNLKLAMLAIPGAGWTAAAIIGLGLLAKAVFDTNETFRNFVKNIGGVVASDFRSAVDGMADDAKDSAANIQKAYEELPPGLSPIAKFIRELFEGAFKDTSNAAETSATASSNAFADFFNGLISQGAAAFNGLSLLIANWWNGLPGPIRNILGGNAASVLTGAAGAAGSAASRASAPNAQATGIYGRYGAPSSQVPFAKKTPAANAMNTSLGSTVGGGSGGRAAGGGADKAANDAKRAADEAKREAQRVADVVRDQEFITKQKGVQTKFAQLIFEAEQAADPIRARQLQTVEALVLAGNETARLLEEETNRTAQLAIARTRQGEAEAIRQEGMLAVLDLQLQQQKNFDEIIAGLDLELALKTATTEQAREQLRLEAEIAKLKGQGFTPEQTDAIKGKKTELAKPKEESQKIEERLGKVKDELKELTSLSYQVTQGAEAIGGAFQQAFMGLVSGSMTAKEALASFFKSVADHFLDMASQMIAKMIEMFILQTILGIGGGGGNYSSAFKSAPKTSFGGALAMPKLMAEGGFVTGPTSAVIGEGGESEYVIPASKMQSAMSRYSRGARGEGVIAGSGGGTEGGGGAAAAGPMVVDVRYSVERINDVEYVTASAFQAGMRQAAQQGAAQGEQRTLRRLQQSPGTRKRVGM